jgi:hypothetical protein
MTAKQFFFFHLALTHYVSNSSHVLSILEIVELLKFKAVVVNCRTETLEQMLIIRILISYYVKFEDVFVGFFSLSKNGKIFLKRNLSILHVLFTTYVCILHSDVIRHTAKNSRSVSIFFFLNIY